MRRKRAKLLFRRPVGVKCPPLAGTTARLGREMNYVAVQCAGIASYHLGPEYNGFRLEAEAIAVDAAMRNRSRIWDISRTRPGIG